MMRTFSAVLLALVSVGTSVLAAQTSLGVGMQYLSFGGSDFDGTEAGMGFEGNVMFPAGKAFMVGGSLQWSTHNNALSDDLTAIGIFGEGRYLFRSTSGSKVTPYVGGRFGYARGTQTISAAELGGSTGSVDLSAGGLTFGGGAGLMIGLSPTIALDLNGMIHSVSFGDFHAKGTVDGTSIDDDLPDTSASGTAMQFRAGLSFKLGGARQ